MGQHGNCGGIGLITNQVVLNKLHPTDQHLGVLVQQDVKERAQEQSSLAAVLSIEGLLVFVLEDGLGLGEDVHEEFVEFGQVFRFGRGVSCSVGFDVPGELLVERLAALLDSVQRVKQL